MADRKFPTYLVVWGGGYEAPSYAAFSTEKAAWAQAHEWEADLQEDEGDYIDVLRITPDLRVERVEPVTPTVQNGDQ